MNARPFPWANVDSLKRADVVALREMRSSMREILDEREALRALSELTNVRLGLELRRVRRASQRRALADGVEVRLAPADDPEAELILELEGALAASLVSRALKRPPPRLMAPTDIPSASIAGALAALLAAAARRGHRGAPLVARAAGPSTGTGTGAGTEGARAEFDVATFTVLVEDEAYVATVSVPRRAVRREAPWNADVLESLGTTPLEIPLVAAAWVTTHDDLAHLRTGDAWIPEGFPLTRTASGWAGPAWAAAPASEYGVRVDLGEDGRAVLRGERDELPWTPPRESRPTGEPTMSEAQKNEAVIDAMGDVPVVVRVEIGSARMLAKEWAALAPGDIVALGRRVAEPVVLRVSGTEVARGELVEIEGEVGVRILTRTHGGA